MSILRTNQIQDTGTNVAANISGGVITFSNTPVGAVPNLTYLSAKLTIGSGGYTISSGNIITPFETVGTTNGITMSNNNRFTVGSAGVYQIKTRFYTYGNSNPSTVGYLIKVNGSEVARMVFDTAGFVGSNGDFVTQCDWAGELSANDYIEFYNNSSTLTGFASSDHHNRISIYKLGTV